MSEPDERYHRLLYLVIVAQFIVIAILLGAFSNEYLSNAYMQDWIQRNAPGLSILLNGGLDALIVGIAVGLIYLLIRNRRETIKPSTQQGTTLPQQTPNSASTG